MNDDGNPYVVWAFRFDGNPVVDDNVPGTHTWPAATSTDMFGVPCWATARSPDPTTPVPAMWDAGACRNVSAVSEFAVIAYVGCVTSTPRLQCCELGAHLLEVRP